MTETYNFPSNIEAVANKCGCVFTDKNDFQDIVKESQYEIEKIIMNLSERLFESYRKYLYQPEWDNDNPLSIIYEYLIILYNSDEDSSELDEFRQLIKNHFKYTGSTRASEILKDWEYYRPKFVKVMPTEYRRALTEIAEQQRASGAAA